MARTVIFLLPSLSWHPVSSSFKQLIAESFAQPTCSPNPRCSCLTLWPVEQNVSPHTCAICNVSKSGSALHAFTNSDVAERTLPAGPRYSVSATTAVSGWGQMMVSSVSFGHAATNPEVGGSESPPASSDPSVKSLTGWISPRNQGDRQPLNFRIPVGRKRAEN